MTDGDQCCHNDVIAGADLVDLILDPKVDDGRQSSSTLDIQQAQLTSSCQDVVDTIDALLADSDRIACQVVPNSSQEGSNCIENREDDGHPINDESAMTSSSTVASVDPDRVLHPIIQERLSLDGLMDNLSGSMQEEEQLETSLRVDEIGSQTSNSNDILSGSSIPSTSMPSSLTTTSSNTSSVATTSVTSTPSKASKATPKTTKKLPVKKSTTSKSSSAQTNKKSGKNASLNQSSQVGSSSDQSQDTTDSSNFSSSGSGGQFVVNNAPGVQIACPLRPAVGQQAFNMMPQQFLQLPSGQSIPLQGLQNYSPGQVVLARPGGQAMTAGQSPLMQIIQTPNGPQLVQMPLQCQVQGKPAVSTIPVTRVANKQILPKPSSASSSSSNTTSTSTSTITNPSPNVIRPSLVPQQQAGQPQLIIGQNSQGASLIQGPNGTLVLNAATLQGHLQGQPFLIQGNMGGTGPVQLTLRTQSSPQVIVGSSASNHTPLINALTSSVASSQSSVLVSESSTQPRTAIVQTANGPQAILLSSSNQSRPGIQQPNVLLNRPPIPSVIQSPQFLTIQTPNGPMLVQLQTPSQTANIPTSMPMMTSASTAQQLFTTSNLIQSGLHGQQMLLTQQGISVEASQLNIIGQQPTDSKDQEESSDSKKAGKGKKTKGIPQVKKPAAKSKKSKAKGVNLADLLKESGILDSSPPTSPTTEATVMTSPQGFVPQQLPGQPTMFMMSQGQGLPGNLVLSQGVAPQLRLALTVDGNVVLQQNVQPAFSVPPLVPETGNNSKLLDSVKDSSQPSPDSTTPTLDAVTPVVTPSVKTALQEHLNNKAASSTMTKKEAKKTVKKSPKKEVSSQVKQEAILSSNDLIASPGTTASSASKTSKTTTAVIRIGNCDSLVQASTLPVILSAESLDKKEDCTVGRVPVVQISLDDNQFAERLDNQIRSLSANQSATDQQKTLLTELETLKKTIQEAKSKQAVQNVSPVTSTAAEGVKLLIAVPPRKQEPCVVQTSQTLQATQLNHQVLQSNTHSSQMVNLLNPTSGVQTNPTIRLITTPVTSESTGTSMIHVGNQQFITISSPAKPGNTSNIQVPNASPLIQVLRFQTPQQQPVVTPSVTTVKADPAVEAEKRKVKVLKLFKQQLDADQRLVVRPDVKTAFKSPEDACKRLLRYHVFNSDDKPNLEQVDEDFARVSMDLLIRKQILFDRFQRTLLRQKCLKHETPERIMLNKLFVEDETNALKLDKEVVAQGIPLDLPPPPKSWQNEISASIEAEVQREERNLKRKLPFLDEDLSEHFEETKPMSTVTPALITTSVTGFMTESVMNLEGNVDQTSLGQENDSEDDDEEDSDDDETDDDESNPADDMSAYLGPNNDDDQEEDNIDSIYDDINYDTRPGLGDLNPFAAPTHHLDHLTWVSQQPTSYTSWSTPRVAFNDVEAAVAVDSILSSQADDQVNRLSEEDYARIQLRGDTNEEAPQNSYSMADGVDIQHRHHDSQMQSAIDSILGEIPSTTTGKPYFSDVYGTRSSAGTGFGVNNERGMPLFGQPIHGQMNDPALDEAVKSILS